MCGIVGYLDRSGTGTFPIGETLFRMLDALGCRGPDSAGVAIFGPTVAPNLVLRIKLGERGDCAARGAAVVDALGAGGTVHAHAVTGEYLRAIVGPARDLAALAARVEGAADGIELVSAGTQLEIVKQVGSPANLERAYGVRAFRGAVGIGHTRLSTESRVDLSHSQPFWARGVPDLATVHNGHITNYHKLRRRYEQRGVRFYTENDSELIGIYLADRLHLGDSLEAALDASLRDFDGSFCYLAATGDSLAYVKDGLGLKPLMVAETDDFVAIATEEIALRASLRDSFEAVEPGPGRIQTWTAACHAIEGA
jgi:glutamate synthase domain-containing protein 1